MEIIIGTILIWALVSGMMALIWTGDSVPSSRVFASPWYVWLKLFTFGLLPIKRKK